MITIQTMHGILELPTVADTETARGNCEHGVSFFEICRDCEWLDAYRERTSRVKPACRLSPCNDSACRMAHPCQDCGNDPCVCPDVLADNEPDALLECEYCGSMVEELFECDDSDPSVGVMDMIEVCGKCRREQR